MVDGFAIFVTHVLLLIAFWRLHRRDDLDREAAPARAPVPPGFGPPGFGPR